MAEDPDGPLPLPEHWVHADETPTWTELGDAPIAFVRWRLDRWASLERLHRLDRAAREIDGDAIVLGLHASQPPTSAERVRDVLLARGTWAPTGLLEGPDEAEVGETIVVADGEIVERFDAEAPIAAVRDELATHSRAGEPAWRPRGDAPGPWPLAFPNDVAVRGSRLAVADTGHNRVVVARPGGDILHLVGDGVPGHRDGSLAEARFEAPRGLCWRGEKLLVADTGNDAVRLVDTGQDEVTTLAQGSGWRLPVALARPNEDETLVALAGEGRLARLTSDGLADLDDREGGDLGHPVDVVADGDDLLWANLEGARVERLAAAGERSTVWKGEPLVEPTGLLAGEGLRVADPGSGTLFALADDGLREVLGPSAGPEGPAALDREADRLIVTDGGGHHLWRADPAGEEAPTRIRLTESPLSLAEHIRLDPVEMAPGARLELSISYMLKDGARAPEEVQPPIARGPVLGLDEGEGPLREEGRIRVELAGAVAASGNLRIRWSLTAEEIGHEAAWDLPIVVRPGADEKLRLALSTSPP